MPNPAAHIWPQSPISSDIGTIHLCGRIHENKTISPQRMRLLGNYVMVLVLGGNAFYQFPDEPLQPLRRGDALLFAPDQRHAYGSMDKQPWDQVYVVFDGPIFDLLYASRSFTSHLPRWHLEPPDHWLRRLQTLLSAHRQDTPESNLRTLSGFANLLAEMAAHKAEAQSESESQWLDKSRLLLGEPQEGIWLSAHQVAEMTGKSYESFRKLFRDKTGQSPQRFQQQRRIELACASIYRGTHSFKTVAEESGFCDVYHFSRTFTRIMGMPPSEYRRKVQGG